MDQLKEILKQAIKYRFWIAVGVAALLPMIAFFIGASPVRAKAAAASTAIVSAEKSAKQFASGVLPNAQYKGLVGEKTEVLTKDVEETWKTLYKLQAPLLTWPKRVHQRFTSWGRQWPEKVDDSAVQIAIIDYVNAYATTVSEVYKVFKPFDPETGKGIVSAPPEEVLLRPAQFTVETPPDLGKVWSAQERLWIQRTLLEVVAEVNKNAKNWDSAPLKQINALEVGNSQAQDQRSIARGDTLEEAPAIVDPSKPAEAVEESSSSSPMAEMMGKMGGAMMGGRGGAAANTESVLYIKNESTQFKVLPVLMSVLIEQDHVQDFLVALANSPMSVQVMDFEMARPSARVTKPVKGASMDFGGYGGMGGMQTMMGMMGGGKMGGMTGYGGLMSQGGMGGMMGMMGGRGMMGAMGGMGGTAERKGVDKRSEDRKKKADEQRKAVESAVTSSLHDPYYNIVEVKVYGQARFFNPPPGEGLDETASSGNAGGTAAKTAPDEAKAKTVTDKASAATEGEDAGSKSDSAKAEGEPDAASEEKTDGDEADSRTEGDDTAKNSAPPTSEDGAKSKDKAPAEKENVENGEESSTNK
ncbi:MAG: hypothetical protein NVSMB9_07890 [Isosphaeraceae bacterium]